jgi:magnesium transporter
LTVTGIDGLVIAVLAALMGAATVEFFGDQSSIEPIEIGIILFVSVIVSFSVGGLVGSSIPIILRRMGQDPALASNIFLTMTTDLVSFGGFLITAALLL